MGRSEPVCIAGACLPPESAQMIVEVAKAHRGLLAVLFALLVASCSAGDKQQGAPPPMPVTVATPVVQSVVDWDDYVGRFESPESVDVKPRATGYLQAVHFRDGQHVRAGQLLFTIDARPSQAALAQAQAQLARALATLANARTELARSRTLASQQAASVEEVEQRQAAVRTGEADVAASRAAIRAQQLNVGFTRVTAPISGLVSERLVDPGNSVTADQTVLTRIVSTDPLQFAFDGSEAMLLKYERDKGGDHAGTPVRIRLQDETGYLHAGRLDFVSPELNPGAGTVHVRAIVPNPTGFLKPGMFGHVRVAGSQPYPALLVPDSAIVTDAARRVVYVVDSTGTVHSRPVELGPLTGNMRVIRSGLSPQDLVIMDGIQRAHPGQKVKPHRGKMPALTGPDTTPEAGAMSAPSSTATPAGGSGL